MSYLVLARKYRPQTFDEVIGQAHVTQTLANAISSARLAHAILFSGPRGTGKTTIARIVAKAMNCETGPAPVPCNQCRSCKEIASGSAVDVFEIDGASNNGVEQIRELRENIKYMPSHSSFKIYIIDEVHMLSMAAFNALLKTLEEPPAHILFLFATTEPGKIPVTILSRCQRHDLKRIEADAIVDALAAICEKERIQVSRKSLELIAWKAEGSMRDALSLLDQAVTGIDGAVDPASISEVLGVVNRKIVADMAAAVFKGDAAAALDIIDEVYRCGYSISDFYTSLIEHFRHLLIAKLSRNVDRLLDLPDHEMAEIQRQAEALTVPFIHQMLEVLFSEERAIKWSAKPKMVLEVAIVKMLQMKPVLPIEDLIAKIDDFQKMFCQAKEMDLSGGGERDDGGTPPGAGEKASDASADLQPCRAPTGGKAKAKPPEHPSALEGASLDDTWRRLMDVIAEKHPSIASNLAQSKLHKLTDARLEIEVNGSIFNLNRVKKRDNIQILKTIAADFFNREMQVAITAGAEKKNNGRPQRDAVKRLKKELLSHPLVAEAIEIFDGKLVDVDVF
jgi:DNA polymerase-3 subunit gamma/tau